MPVGTAAAPEAGMLAWLPLVGAVVGGLAGAGGWLVSLWTVHALAVAAAFGLSIALTGALHIDGFLDSCDALFASVSPLRRQEILKDPHHGTFAVASFAVLCSVWLAALWSIDPQRLPIAIAFAATAARWIAVSITFVTPYGAAGVRPPLAVHAAMAVLVVALSWQHAIFAVCALVVAALTFLTAGWIRVRLGGRLSGDSYGFLIACAEVAVTAGIVRG